MKTIFIFSVFCVIYDNDNPVSFKEVFFLIIFMGKNIARCKN